MPKSGCLRLGKFSIGIFTVKTTTTTNQGFQEHTDISVIVFTDLVKCTKIMIS